MRSDHGRRVYAVFDRELDGTSVRAEDFSMTDENGAVFVPFAAVLSEDVFRIRLDFADFNRARGECCLRYVPGTLRSLAGEAVPEDSFVFLPTGLSGDGEEDDE